MTTLQEWLDKKYPTKEERKKVEKVENNTTHFRLTFYDTEKYDKKKKEIEEEYKKSRDSIWLSDLSKEEQNKKLDQAIIKSLEEGSDLEDEYRSRALFKKFKKGGLDLSEYTNLKSLKIAKTSLTKLELSKCNKLISLECGENQLTSIDFLIQLPCPEKLERLEIYDNNIESTTLEFLRPFTNLKDCKLGENISKNKKEKKELEQRLQSKTYNKFYGSLEPIKNLTKLEKLCIAGTDVDEGIEYIPTKIAKLSTEAVKKGENPTQLNLIDCQPLRPSAKVAKIQNELRLFNYDIEAWQLAHPEKMLIARPELFTNPDSREKWLEALNNKITQSQETLNHITKIAKTARLETKIQELELAKSTIHQQTQTEFSTQDKGTQTDLAAEQTTKLEQKNQQLKKNYEKETQNTVKEIAIPFKIDNSTPQTEEEIKWETIKTGIEKETELTRLANRSYWDIQIQNLQDNLLPANKQTIVLKNRCWQREQQIKAKIEKPPKNS
ncbi:hypothetical protein [endosymbiont GvMRE of Glomus versiforme]|uniref:hypothetical protein n=1 Tax=endosymbiont GvMRE of Glomus versiforme TaxID=2039283 RepID=UPI000ECBCC15|nr:hypothetical protein [endosymbiont GvMRE of Glomus versiforme]RHZ35245.1 HET domain protein [endosymbiont GvMRE of Glomus versiforme]